LARQCPVVRQQSRQFGVGHDRGCAGLVLQRDASALFIILGVQQRRWIGRRRWRRRRWGLVRQDPALSLRMNASMLAGCRSRAHFVARFPRFVATLSTGSVH